MTVDSGHLWIAEKLASGLGTRVDEFDASTGAFLPPQLNEEGSVRELDGGVAAGHATPETEVYVPATTFKAGTTGGFNVAAVFDSSGSLQSVWTGAGTPNGSFVEHENEAHEEESVGQVRGVAVDGHSPGIEDWAAGDVYVVTTTEETDTTATGQKRSAEELEKLASFNVVDVFTPQAGGKEPSKVAAQLKGTCPSPGKCAENEVIPFANPVNVAVSAATGDVMVTDEKIIFEEEEVEGKLHRSIRETESVVDVFEPASGLPGVYNFLFTITGAGTPNGSFKTIGGVGAPIGGIAAGGASGDIYVVDMTSNAVDEFNATGEYVDRLTGTSAGHPFSQVHSVAVDPQAPQDVYVGDFDAGENKGFVDVFGPDVVVPDVTVTEPVSNLTATSATLHGTVNPVEAGEATCEFEFGTSTSYGRKAPCMVPVANGNLKVSVESKSMSVTGLQPDTIYHYRLDATNVADGGTNIGQGPEGSEDLGEFTTPGPGIHSESVSDVRSTSATFEATINPHNAPTTYYFQYGPSTGYGSEAPLLTASEPRGAVVGSSEGDVEVAQHVQVGLSAGAVYHYRVVAVSEIEVAPEKFEAEEFDGEDRTFTTQAAGTFALSDGRAWEMVSPPDKHGADILAPSEGHLAFQAAVAGDAITYVTTAPTESQPQGFSNLMQVLSTRGGGGGGRLTLGLAGHRDRSQGRHGREYRSRVPFLLE